MIKSKKFTVILFLLVSAFYSNAQINTDRMLAIGRNALYFEDYVLAIQYFNKIIRVKPYLAEPYYFRSIAKYSLDDYKGAEEDIKKALEINPYLVNAYNLYGIIKQKEGDAEEAVKIYSKGLEIEPDNINLLINRGNSKMYLKKYNEAIEDYNTALKYSPNIVSALVNRGMARVNEGDTIGAINDFSKVIKLNPYLPDGFANRGILYYQQNEFEKALADYNKVIELEPDEPSFYMNRGVIRYQLDDLKGTLADFDKVIELDPKNAMAYANRGILRAQVGDYNRAIEDFSRVLALDPTDLLTLYNRGLLYNQIGEYDKAIADFDIVAENYPDFAPVYYARAMAKQKLNDLKGFTEDYNTAMKLEADKRNQSDKKALASNNGTKDKDSGEEDGKKHPKATRKKSDKDIRNYDKIAVLDDFGQEEVEEEVPATIRGKIQNRNIIIDLEPVFGLSFYSADSLMIRNVYFEPEVEKFNNKKLFPVKLKITNREAEAEGYKALAYFNQIKAFSDAIDNNKCGYECHFIRGVLYSLVMNYNNAIMDYDAVLKQKPDDILTLFNRAYVRYKMVEVIRAMEEEMSVPNPVNLKGTSSSISVKGTVGTVAPKKKKEEQILDYQYILDDLNKVIELDETFEFAWYNRGIVKAILKDYEGAVEDFSKAIEINPDFAEAYFNRGLTELYLQQEDKGIEDLSKSGELGLIKAYNVIKRYMERKKREKGSR
ncbi:MAG: tetratricopeptide repeat protein [Chlorobi bacterium]|nr:tetratricopeptide repeat protein [Chlorobiota bacterium]